MPNYLTTRAAALLASALAVAAPLPACRQQESPAEDAISLREIVQGVEGREYGPIEEIAYDDAHWQIDAYKAGAPVHLAVDPATGAVVAEQPRDDSDAEDAPPAGSLSLSKILETLEAEQYTNVTAVDFDDDLWEIEALRNGEPHEVHINPATGEIVAFRPKDFDG